jgi:hypothetical protein
MFKRPSKPEANAPATVSKSWSKSPEDPISRIAGYFGVYYSGPDGLHGPNTISALGAAAGFFAQQMARAMLSSGTWTMSQHSFLKVETKIGQNFFFGDAISAALFGSKAEGPGLLNYVAAFDNSLDGLKSIDIGELASHAAQSMGTEAFGIPRIAQEFRPTLPPIVHLKRDVTALLHELNYRGVKPAQYADVFGSAGQFMMKTIAGETNIRVAVQMPKLMSLRLFMEAAVPMSKLDPNDILSPQPKG